MRVKFIMAAMLSGLAAFSSDFSEAFADSTVRVDLHMEFTPRGATAFFGTPRLQQRWYGRRVNLDKELFPASLIVTVTDAASGDTLYLDTKNPPYAEGEDNILNTVLNVPAPKRPVDLGVGVAGDPRGYYSARLRLHPDSLGEARIIPARPFRTLHRALDAHRALNIAIVADGYTAEQADMFMRDAARLDSVLFTHPAFAGMADVINVTAVMNSQPLGSSFDSFGLARLLTIPDVRPLWDALACVPAQHVIILTNTDTYGGSGSYNEYCIASAHNEWSDQVTVHEFGHSFANLGDEYEADYGVSYTPDFEPVEPNITTLHDFGSKWKDMYDAGQAGLIEGAGYQSHGVWRAFPHCLMRAVQDRDFCPVCSRAFVSAISFYTN